MARHRFRVLAVDETDCWISLPAGCRRVFGLYLFHEGEATYCCSLAPSSWCEHLGNVFCGLPTEHPFVEAHAGANPEDDHYRALIRPKEFGGWVSAPRDWDRAELDAADGEAAEREAAWAAAREDFGGNEATVPNVDAAYRAAAA